MSLVQREYEIEQWVFGTTFQPFWRQAGKSQILIKSNNPSKMGREILLLKVASRLSNTGWEDSSFLLQTTFQRKSEDRGSPGWGTMPRVSTRLDNQLPVPRVKPESGIEAEGQRRGQIPNARTHDQARGRGQSLTGN